jgi:uncharacterized protein
MIGIPASSFSAPVRLPLPSAIDIAALPEDGGPEFNRLVFEQSPYLLQHARNPVDWWPWGPEAFAKAKAEDKPIFLSVGYTTCHWCHVMEHESFEDAEVAALINEKFIAIKVDREERPDIDEIYMQVTQAMTGGGGWPMTVMMTPDQHPFFAGTYFPKESSPGRPGIKLILTELHKAWVERREEVVKAAGTNAGLLRETMVGAPGEVPEEALLTAAFEAYVRQFDVTRGGFGSGPKFPVAPNLQFLLRYHQRTGSQAPLEMVETSLRAMRQGGIYDHVGHGIHRYAVDAEWLVPHFEKMLYDQALAVQAYTEAWQVTGKEEYARTAREILSYVASRLTDPAGGFYSAEDADSEGVEGKFYLWSEAEVNEVLGEADGAFWCEIYGFEESGNFQDEATREKTGTNITYLSTELDDATRTRLEPLRIKLDQHREMRVHPQKDDKILSDWNGLMISACARAAQAFGDPAHEAMARRAGDFVLEKLVKDGRLLKRYREGEAGLTGHLEDYAFMIAALLDLYETTFELRYYEQAIAFQKILDDHFWDPAQGGYFTIADDAEELIVRAKRLYGGAIPSGNAVSFCNLVRLHRMTGETTHATRSVELLKAFAGEINNSPISVPTLLCGLDFHFGPSFEIVISDGEAAEFLTALRRPFLPNKTILRRTESNAAALARLSPFTETQVGMEGKATVYVCQNFSCQAPTTSLEKMLESLGIQRAP